MKGIDAYETHDWVMKRGRNNRLGEPTYFSLCDRCGMKPNQAMQSDQPCKGDISDRSSYGDLSGQVTSEYGEPD